MYKDYKVALAIDKDDLPEIRDDLMLVESFCPHDLTTQWTTPDCTYVCFYWENIHWDMPQQKPLLRKLEHIRHALITIDEDGETWKDILSFDGRGCDEEFEELLHLEQDISFFNEGEILAPLKSWCRIPRSRTIELLKRVLDMDPALLADAGMSTDEMDALCPDLRMRLRDCILDVICESYPELADGEDFEKPLTFDIGFYNPNKESWQGDGIANDETELDAASLSELQKVWLDFCDENGLTYDSVRYVDILEDEQKEEVPAVSVGDRVRLLRMPGDPRPVPPGTEGVVASIDDLGQIHVGWENGQSLALIPGVDRFVRVNEEPVPVGVPVTSCIVIKHSFDADVIVYEYDTEEEAVKALHRLYDSYMDEEKRNNSPLYEASCFCDDDYAKITWADEETTEFVLSFISKEV